MKCEKKILIFVRREIVKHCINYRESYHDPSSLYVPSLYHCSYIIVTSCIAYIKGDCIYVDMYYSRKKYMKVFVLMCVFHFSSTAFSNPKISIFSKINNIFFFLLFKFYFLLKCLNNIFFNHNFY